MTSRYLREGGLMGPLAGVGDPIYWVPHVLCWLLWVHLAVTVIFWAMLFFRS